MNAGLNQTSEKNKSKRLLSRCFSPRDVFVRCRDNVSFHTLSSGTQACLFSVLCLAVCWLVFTSVYFIGHYTAAVRQDGIVRDTQSAYQTLREEVAVFHEYLTGVLTALDENRQSTEELKQASAAAVPAKIRKLDDSSYEKDSVRLDMERLDSERDRLRAELSLLQKRFAVLADSSGRRQNDDGRIPLYKAVLQRDLAIAETETLQQKVSDLENLIVGMQDTQIRVFRKMASLVGNNINLIEDDLSGVRQSLGRTGLGMDSLLNRIRRDKDSVGIGGPFIPAQISKVPKSSLNISLASLNQRLDRWYDLTALQQALPIGKPLNRIRVTSPFGTRGDPFQDGPARHEAIDLGGMIGEPVHTTAAGKVVVAGRRGWYGNMVEIDHGLGFRTRYAHMDKVFVTKGDTVRSGDQIGTVGNTGRSTGAHLHYEIRVRGHAVDPMQFIKAKKDVFKN